MKTTIKLNRGIVELAYDGEDYDLDTVRRLREFMVPETGGYVREWDDSHRDWRQVCERLSSRGNTLHSNSGDPHVLLSLIRREWRRSKHTRGGF